MSRAGVLQDQLNKSEAALSTALSQNAALTSELAEVNSLLAKVCMSTEPDICKKMVQMQWCQCMVTKHSWIGFSCVWNCFVFFINPGKETKNVW